VHGQAADVAAGKEERRDDMAVGRYDQPAKWNRHDSSVVALPEVGIAQPAGKQFLDQLCHRASAAAVRQVDAPVLQVERSDISLAHAAHRLTADSGGCESDCPLRRPYE